MVDTNDSPRGAQGVRRYTRRFATALVLFFAASPALATGQEAPDPEVKPDSAELAWLRSFAGYRRVHVDDGLLDLLYIIGIQGEFPLRDRPDDRWFVGLRLGFAGTERRDSEIFPGGDDEITGMLVEPEAGWRHVLARTASLEWSLSLALTLPIDSRREHLSGPNGEHDHVDDDHDDHWFVGVGVFGETQASWKIAPHVALSLSLGGSISTLGPIGPASSLEASIGVTVDW